jgi:hypothetical protein
MDKTFYNKKGELTRYALACGYIQRYEKNNQSIDMYCENASCIHVRQFNRDTGKRIFWDSFTTLTEARKRYNKAVKLVDSLDIVPSWIMNA